MYNIRYGIVKDVFNFRDPRNLVLGIVSGVGITLVGLSGKMENAIKSPVENKDLFYYVSNSVEGLAIGLAGGAALYAVARGIDYIGNRRKKGIIDIMLEQGHNE